MADYNGGRSGERKTAAQKIAEQRRRKNALEEVQGPRLGNRGTNAYNTPRLSSRNDIQDRQERPDRPNRQRAEAPAPRKSANRSVSRKNDRNIQLFPGTGASRVYTKPSGKALFGKRSRLGGSGGKKLIAIGAVVAAVLVMLFMLTKKNAVEVFVDGNSVGVVMDKNYDAETIKTTCTARLVSDHDTNVEITSNIETKKVHARKSDKNVSTADYLLKEINEVLKYNVEATAIVVNGSEMAVVSNNEAAQTVVDRIRSEHKLSYIEDTSTIVEGPEIEGLEYVSKFVDGTEILSTDQAYDKLNGTRQETLTYTVAAGDSIGKIAARYGLGVSELMASNPDITDATRISVGDEIKIDATVPILNIKVVTQTVDRSSGTAVIEKTTYINGNVSDTTSLDSSKADSADDENDGDEGADNTDNTDDGESAENSDNSESE